MFLEAEGCKVEPSYIQENIIYDTNNG